MLCYNDGFRPERYFPTAFGARDMAFGMSMTHRLMVAVILAGGLMLLLRWALA